MIKMEADKITTKENFRNRLVLLMEAEPNRVYVKEVEK